jgi:pyruvate formate lyase activating enzyme
MTSICPISIWLYSILRSNPETYRSATGRDLAPTLKFAERLAGLGKRV